MGNHDLPDLAYPLPSYCQCPEHKSETQPELRIVFRRSDGIAPQIGQEVHLRVGELLTMPNLSSMPAPMEMLLTRILTEKKESAATMIGLIAASDRRLVLQSLCPGITYLDLVTDEAINELSIKNLPTIQRFLFGILDEHLVFHRQGLLGVRDLAAERSANNHRKEPTKEEMGSDHQDEERSEDQAKWNQQLQWAEEMVKAAQGEPTVVDPTNAN